MEEVDQGFEQPIGQLVKSKNAHTYNDTEGQYDQRIVQGLFPSRPLDLFQLGLGFFKPLANAGEHAGLGLLLRLLAGLFLGLFLFYRSLGSVDSLDSFGLGGLHRVQLFVFSH